MLPITNALIPVNRYSRPGTKLKSVKGIVMHYTASNGAPAKNIVSYFGNLRLPANASKAKPTFASAHYSVVDISIVRALPDNEVAYHTGSSQGYTKDALSRLSTYPNNCTLGVEMCLDKNGKITEKTFQNCVDLVAYLCKQYKLTEKDIWTHIGVVGWKQCPLPWIQKPSEFTRFKQEVSNKLKPVTTPPPKPPVPAPPYKMGEKDIEKVTRFLSALWFIPIATTTKNDIHKVAESIRKGQNVPKEHAEKAILFLSAGWKFVDNATDRKEFNRLANEIRKAADLPQE